MNKNRKLPNFMITYLCNKCGMDFAISERDKPKCFYCDSTKDYVEIKRQKLTAQAIADRLKLINDRLEENLKKAYACKPDKSEMIENRDSEMVLLDTMDKAKKLNKNIQQIFKKK